MGEYAIKARFDVAAPPVDVMKWLDSVEGIAGWWSDTVTGSAGTAGDEFHVSFPTTDAIFELVVSEATDTRRRWDVPESPPWWRGTSISFLIEEAEGGASMLFTHSGFDPEDPIIAVITPAWVGFLNNLVAVAQSGQPSPAVLN